MSAFVRRPTEDAALGLIRQAEKMQAQMWGSRMSDVERHIHDLDRDGCGALHIADLYHVPIEFVSDMLRRIETRLQVSAPRHTPPTPRTVKYAAWKVYTGGARIRLGLYEDASTVLERYADKTLFSKDFQGGYQSAILRDKRGTYIIIIAKES